MWCSECRFNGVGGGQRCGVVNADLAVSAVAIDVGQRMQILRSVNRGHLCGVRKKTYGRPVKWGRSECRFNGVRGGQRCGAVNADLAVSAATTH